MAKFLKRLTSSYKEEPLFVKIVVKELEILTNYFQQGIVVAWQRGNTSEQSDPVGNVSSKSKDIKNLNVTFTRLSVFYRSQAAGPPSYQEKKTTLFILAKTGENDQG